MMKKWMTILLCALLSLAPLAAMGAARMPEKRGVVTDDADVLSTQTATDLTEYAGRLEKEADIQLYVAVVHFLDGADAQTYADQLFEKWKLGPKDMLLLCAAGEDSFATAQGSNVQKSIGKANADNLMFTSSQFSALIRSQRYDEAMLAYCQALNTLVEKQTGKQVSLKGLFGQTSAVQRQTTEHYASSLWQEVMGAISESSVDYQAAHVRHEREANGLTAGGWLVLLVLVLIVMRQSKSQKSYGRRRRNERKGKLGKILGVVGLGVLFKHARRRH